MNERMIGFWNSFELGLSFYLFSYRYIRAGGIVEK
jgi:hypothetical protein